MPEGYYRDFEELQAIGVGKYSKVTRARIRYVDHAGSDLLLYYMRVGRSISPMMFNPTRLPYTDCLAPFM